MRIIKYKSRLKTANYGHSAGWILTPDGVNYDKRFYINTTNEPIGRWLCERDYAHDWRTRNKSMDVYTFARSFVRSFEFGPSRLNAKSSSRLYHGNKKIFFIRMKIPRRIQQSTSIENSTLQYRRFDIVSVPENTSRSIESISVGNVPVRIMDRKKKKNLIAWFCSLIYVTWSRSPFNIWRLHLINFRSKL